MRELRLIALVCVVCSSPSAAQWHGGMSVGPVLRLGGNDINPARWGFGATVFATRPLGVHVAWRSDVALQAFGTGGMVFTSPCPPGAVCTPVEPAPGGDLTVAAVSTSLVFFDTPASYVVIGAGVASGGSRYGLSGVRPLVTAGFGYRLGRQAALYVRYQYVRAAGATFATLPVGLSLEF